MPKLRSGWKLWLGYGLVVATVFFAFRYLELSGGDLLAAVKAMSPATVLVAALLFATHIVANAFAFSALNRAFGVGVPLSELVSAWLATLLAKYVPGGIWHVVGRDVLLGGKGVPSRVTFLVGFGEQAFSLAICAMLAAAFLWKPDFWVIGKWLLVLGFVAMIFVPSAIVGRLGMPVLTFPFALGACGYLLAMLPYALGYLLIVGPEAPAKFLGALFGGTVAGVLALPVPGGMGVRESATAFLMSSADAATLFAGMLAARAVILGLEIVLGFLGMFCFRRTARS